MPAKHLEANVRQEPGVAVIDLGGEINGFAQEALDAAYAEAESNDPEAILLNFEGVDLHQLDRHRPYREPPGASARLQAPPAGLQPERALREDLRHHAPL
jgi:hypothetical protein